MAHTTTDQSRRPDRGKRTLKGDADEYHGRGPEVIGGALQSSGLPGHGCVDGSVGVDPAADADASAATADGDAVRSAATAAAWPFGVIVLFSLSFCSCCMGEKNRASKWKVNGSLPCQGYIIYSPCVYSIAYHSLDLFQFHVPLSSVSRVRDLRECFAAAQSGRLRMIDDVRTCRLCSGLLRMWISKGSFTWTLSSAVHKGSEKIYSRDPVDGVLCVCPASYCQRQVHFTNTQALCTGKYQSQRFVLDSTKPSSI